VAGECETKKNYTAFLRSQEESFLNYFKHNRGAIPNAISIQYRILRGKLLKAHIFRRDIHSRQLGGIK
jgi:hypothetical protein